MKYKNSLKALPKIFEKHPVLGYILGTYVKYLLYLLAVFTVIFAVLEFTDIYTRLANALDLKYNSPFVIFPIWGFAALAMICFVIGAILYFYKYKRTKTKSVFSQSFSNILNDNK